MLWVEGNLGEFGVLDHLLLTDSFMLLLGQIVDMYLHTKQATLKRPNLSACNVDKPEYNLEKRWPNYHSVMPKDTGAS